MQTRRTGVLEVMGEVCRGGYDWELRRFWEGERYIKRRKI